MKSRMYAAVCAAVIALSLGVHAQGKAGAASITPAELKDWLSYIASDQLQGRQVYTEGLGLAASYIAEHLEEWKIKPGGDEGSYLSSETGGTGGTGGSGET